MPKCWPDSNRSHVRIGMESAMGRRLGLAITTLGIAASCGGAPEGAGPHGGVDAGSDPGAPCQGMCIGKLVLGPDAFFFDMSLDRNRKRLYGNGLRLDVSNPRAMKATALPKLGPIVVDPTTGRYATTEAPGYGENIRTLFIFNPDDTLYDSKPLPGLPFAMDVDPANGLFFVTTRQDDQIVVYREDSRAVLASRPVGALAMNPVFDPASGEVFVNLAVGAGAEYQWLILERNHETGPASNGHILAADGARRLVYVAVDSADGSTRSRLEVRESATGALASTQIDTPAYWLAPDPALNRLLVQRSMYEIAFFDQTTGAYLASLPLSSEFLISRIAFLGYLPLRILSVAVTTAS